MGIVAATGCNTVYGSTYPYNPYLVPVDELALRERPRRRAGHPRPLGPGGPPGPAAVGARRRWRDVRHRLPGPLADGRLGRRHQGPGPRHAGLLQHRRPGLDGLVRRPGHQAVAPSARRSTAGPSGARSWARILAGARRGLRGPDDARAHQPLLPGGDGGQRVPGPGGDRRLHALPARARHRRRRLHRAGQAGGRLAGVPALHLRPAARRDASPSGCRCRAIRPSRRTGRSCRTATPVDFLAFARTEGRFAAHFGTDGTPTPEIVATQQDRLANWRLAPGAGRPPSGRRPTTTFPPRLTTRRDRTGLRLDRPCASSPPAEAVAGIRSGDQVYVHCAAATPSVLLDALVARAPELHDVGGRPPPHRGPGPAPRARDGRPLPAPRAVHRPERARRGQRGARRLRAGLPVRRAAAVRSRRAAARRRARQRHAARRPRVLLARDVASRRCTRRSAPPGRSSSSSTGAMPRTLGDSFVHVDDIDLGVEVDVPPVRARRRPDRRRRAPDRRTSSPSSSPTARPSSSASARSPPPRRWPSPASATSASTPRCSPTGSSTSSRRGVVTGARKERNRGKIVAAFMMGTQRLYDFVDDNPMVEMRAVDFTNDTHVIRSFEQMAAINSAIEVDLTGQVVADSIGHRHLQRRRRADGLHPRRRARAETAGRSSPCRRPPPAAPSRGSSPSLPTAPAS